MAEGADSLSGNPDVGCTSALGGGVWIGDRVKRVERLRELARGLGQVLYGMTVYEMVRDLNKARASREHLFVLTVFGDLLGVPILPPYYSLRLLPYVVPSLNAWRRSMLREKDLTDLIG